MEKNEKDFLLNKGLVVGFVFSIFPILDYLFGSNISLSTYYGVFYISWFIVYSVLILSIGKEFKQTAKLFDFRNAFRVLFIVSALGFSILTVTKITLWNVFYPGKYIQLNESRDMNLMAVSIRFSESTLLNAYNDGSIDADEYENSLSNLDDQLDMVEISLKEKWNFIKENGISKSLFLGSLIYNLFFISIYNAILALFIRKKIKLY